MCGLFGWFTLLLQKLFKMAMSMGSFATRTVATVVIALDGTGDFTDIQEGLNSLPATGGGVYIKEGTYNINATIEIDIDSVSLIGSGASTIIHPTGNFPAITIQLPAGVGESVTIEKLKIYGTGAGVAQHGIYAEDFNRIWLYNLWIEHLGGNGVYIISSTFASLISLWVTDADGDGFKFVTSYNNFIDSCVVYDCGGNGLYTEDCERCQTHKSSYEQNGGYGINLATSVGGYGFHHFIIGNYVSGNLTGDIIINADIVKTVCLGNITDGIIDNGTNTEIGHNFEATY